MELFRESEGNGSTNDSGTCMILLTNSGARVGLACLSILLPLSFGFRLKSVEFRA